MSAPLTVIHAPTGFGKTTLAAQCVTGYEKTTAWLSLDESDKDPKRFWYATLRALASRFPWVGKQSQFVLDQLDASLDDVTACLINELVDEAERSSEPHFLVFDDFHHVATPELLTSFNRFLDHLPNRWHVLITSRNLPAVKLAQRKSKGRACEVSAHDLRFTAGECRTFFQAVNSEFSDTEIESISQRCEGWAAALRLYGLAGACAIRQMGNGIADEDLYEVLLAEVMADLPESVKNFLIQTAFLPRFCARLTDHVLALHDSAAVIGDLLQRNLFTVALDGRAGWHRYHDLFRAFLLERFALPDADQCKLKVRAANWMLTEGLHEQALELFLSANEWEQAADVLSESGRNFIKQGHGELVRRALDSLPQSVQTSRAVLLCLRVWNATDTEKYEFGRTWLDQAQLALDSGEQDDVAAALVRCELLTLYAIVERLHERWEQTLLYSQAALDAARTVNSPMKWRSFLTLGAHAYLQGDLVHAQHLLEQAVHWSLEDGNDYGSAQSCGYLSEVLYQRGELQKAIRVVSHVRQTLEHRGFDGSSVQGAWRWIGEVDLLREMGQFDQARLVHGELKQLRSLTRCEALQHLIILVREYTLAISQRLPHAARRLLAEIEQVQSKMRFKSVFATGSVDGMQAEVAWLEGDAIKSAHWLSTDAAQSGDYAFVRLRDHLATVRILFSLGRYEAALKQSHELRSAAKRGGYVLAEAIADMWCAMSHHAIHEMEKSRECLLSAFQKIAGQGYRQAFLDQGIGLVPVLEQCADDSLFGSLANELRSTLVAKENDPFLRRATGLASMPAPSEKSPLSQRELDLLAYVREGLSDKEIARLANISPGTVKTHLRNIYRKLEVNGRVQALTKLNWLGAVNANSPQPS